MSSERQHVVLFPFMAPGHYIPFLSLAALLERKTNFAITILTTPHNVRTFQSSLPPQSSVRVASLPFNGPEHGLPCGAEATHALPPPLIFFLFEASRSLEPSFHQFISELKPIVIVSDLFLSWTVKAANELGVFHSVFLANGAYGIAAYFSLWLHLPHTQTTSDEFALPDFPEAGMLHQSQLSEDLKKAKASDPIVRFVQENLTFALRADGLLINTVEELDRTGLQCLARKTSRPIWPVGPVRKQAWDRGGAATHPCITWLDQHPPSSVVYVCFGSQGYISAAATMELARGLEESGRAFVWVVRPPLGFDADGEFREEWLPEGFEERVREKKQGILVRRWAPQMEILSHAATGAFVSHCGWNSVVESLSCGVAVMAWPMEAEQFFNSKMVEEMGVGVEVARGKWAEIEKGKVREVVEMVLGEREKGKDMRRKALEVKEILEAATREDAEFKGSSVRALEQFIEKALAERVKTLPAPSS